MLEVILTSMVEASFFKHIRKEALAASLCFLFWLLGIGLLTPSGAYYVDLIDSFVGSIVLYVVVLVEVFAIIVWYGLDKFSDDCFQMTGKLIEEKSSLLISCSIEHSSELIFSLSGKRLGRYMRFMIKFGLPFSLIVVLISALISSTCQELIFSYSFSDISSLFHIRAQCNVHPLSLQNILHGPRLYLQL